MTSWRWAAEAACSVKLLDKDKDNYGATNSQLLYVFPVLKRNRVSCNNSITSNLFHDPSPPVRSSPQLITRLAM
jgi:hypothetical protein